MKPLALCLAVLLLGGCENHSAQISSGADYLARLDAAAAAASPAGPGEGFAGGPRDIDALVRRAAAVEPLLEFPARFGLARIESGRLTGIPSEEADLWAQLAQKHGALGEFVPVSPLVAAATTAALADHGLPCCRQTARDLFTAIRLGAARQHVDAVLIYEVGAQARRGLTPLAMMDLTIIGGAFLPTRTIKARGVAAAMLLDVRNGYPYGTATADTDLSGLSATWDKGSRTDALREQAALKVARKLVPEVDAMIGQLASRMLAARRAS